MMRTYFRLLFAYNSAEPGPCQVASDDPDGNQLFFNYPAETASNKAAGDEA
jgi:hypothetical protein